MTKAKPAEKETVTDKLDKLMEQGDPLLAAAMIMGGTAAASGLTPPLMRLMQATSGASTMDFEQKAIVAASYAFGLVPGLLYTGFKLGQSDSGGTAAPPGSKETVACFCEGAVEVFLMAKLFSNPEFMKGLMGAASSGVGMLKAVAATGL